MLKYIKTPLLSLIFVISSIGSTQAYTTVVINELMASNSNCIQDPQGQYDDWIEFYNYGTNTVDLGGMYLTDDSSIRTKWQIPNSTTIPAGGYLLIWADNDTTNPGLHANFKLDADGEQVALYDDDGITPIDSVTFPEQTADMSYGRYPDGDNEWRFFAFPSPGEENQGGYSGIVADTKFSQNRGFYDTSFPVTITTETPGATIRYTTDGSTPSETYGRTYTGPIQISTTTCLRAMAYKTGWIPTNVDTQTYIFIDDVITQSQQKALIAGYPGSWTGYPADYAMDPEVYNDPDYSDQMADAMLSIPTLSIATDKDYLFNPSTGIYTNPEEEGDNLEWERPTSAELFCQDGSMEFQINCGIRLQGGHSRKPVKSPKHSFSLRFRDIYGPTSLDYPLFGDDWPVKSFDSLQLRGFFNNAWTHWGPDQRERAQYTHDQWARDAMTEMGHEDALQGIMIHLYLNGIYWGIYNLHERPDADHYAAYNGGNADEIDATNGDPDYIINDPLNTGSVSDGTIDAWHELKDIVASRNWDAICRVLDVNNFIDWTILNYFEGNTDIKRGTNWRAAGGGPQRRPWRFYSWDAEHIFENVEQTTIGVDDPTSLFNYLDDIEEFNILLGDRVHKHLFNNGALTTQKNIDRWTKLSDQVQLAVIAESARWGDYRRDVHSYSSGPYYLYTKNDFWIPENNYITNSYLPIRTIKALTKVFRNRGMYPSIDAPVFNINGSYQHGGHVTSGSSFSITNGTGTIFYSLDGTDPRLPSTSGSGKQTILIPENASKRVLVPTVQISSYWRTSINYNDSSWISGSGGVGYDTGSQYRDLFDIDLYNQMYQGRTSCYIRIPFNVTQNNLFETMTLRIRYDDGFIAYLNGVEIARRNFNGTPSFNSSADTTHSDSLAVNFENIDLSSYLHTIDSGENILAIHGLNESSSSSDFLISAELVVLESSSNSGEGPASNSHEYAGPITLTESVHIKSRVLSGNTWSALNEATYAIGPVAENLRITEIMYHPQNPAEPNDPNEEFIELTNIGSETINLNLVKFTKGINFTFPNIELAPGEYTVVVQDKEAFETKYGSGINIAGQYSGKLDNAGERIRLADAAGQTILDFSYKDG
ncbi:MAG: lamin tail domain-containing protein [Sedimentisphaerales bacterium]|nr:lamin tail domain-containing protein [Sedimentisphaerales bacterium]